MTIVIDPLAGTITGSTSTVPLGAFMHVMRATAPAGWVAGEGGTIGATTSGATRANTDTWPLFALWWADFTDAQLPILTKTGAPSVRGASAGTDWDAEKRLTVFDVRGLFPRAAGTINGVTSVNGTKYADTLKDHSHSLQPMVANAGTGGTSGYSYNSANTGAPLGAGHVQNAGGGLETAPVHIAMLGCFKL